MTPTKKQLAARHKTRLKTMQQLLLGMAAQWEELDQFNANALADLSERVEALWAELLDEEPVL